MQVGVQSRFWRHIFWVDRLWILAVGILIASQHPFPPLRHLYSVTSRGFGWIRSTPDCKVGLHWNHSQWMIQYWAIRGIKSISTCESMRVGTRAKVFKNKKIKIERGCERVLLSGSEGSISPCYYWKSFLPSFFSPALSYWWSVL